VEFVLSADLDWASEYCIEHFLSITGRFSIKPTIFVTHDSAALRRAAREGRVELGIHPNFLQPSTHGESIGSIIKHVLELAPRATSVRCHRHFAGREIERALTAHGLRIDSNTHGHLQGGLAPIELPSGLLRLPVFFEDDCHWTQDMTWRFRDHETDFFSPGLKILNFHPFLVSLNAPDAAFYHRHKRHIPTLTVSDAARLRHQGDGIATFLIEAIRVIQASGCRFVTLGEMADSLGHETLAAELA
jgi:Polysaccharide deacetylase